MNKIILLLGLLLFGSLQAQNLKIQSADSEEALAYATLSSENPKASAVTDINGKVNISEFKGAEKIQIRILGFKNETLSYAQLEAMNFVLKMKTSAFSVDDVVVSAVKWEQKNSEVAMKVMSITSKDVTMQNPQTAADMLGSSGQVFIQKSQQGGGSPMIRGFATNRLLYSVDGVRMNTAIFRGGNLQNVISLDGLAMEKTEVLFGPGSVIYGSDAIGGVMSFTTLQTKFSETKKPNVTGSALARYASANNEITGHFDVNVGLKKFAFLSSVSYSKYDDMKMGRFGPDEYLRKFYVERVDSQDVINENKNPLLQNPSAFSQINMMQKLSYKPTENLQIDYGFHYSETSTYGRYDRNITLTKDNLPKSALWNYGPQVWMMNNLSVAYSKSNVVFDEMKLTLAHQYFKESRIDRSFNSSKEKTKTEKVFAYSVNADFIKNINEKHQVVYGVEFVNDVVHSLGEVKNIKNDKVEKGESRYPFAGWATAAAYLNYQFKVSQKVVLQGGLRYSHVFIDADFSNNQPYFDLPETKFKLSNGALTGSLGAVYSPAKSTKLSINFATGFRAPNIDDLGKLFESASGSAVVVPNTKLKPEYAYNGEIGLSQTIKDVVKIDFAAYYTYLQNAMVRRPFTLNGQDSIIYQGAMSEVQAVQNAANANVYGVQFGLEVKMPIGFSFYGTYNFQRGIEEFDNGDRSSSRHAVPMFGAAHLRYNYQALNLDLYTNFSGGVKNEDLSKGLEDLSLFAKDENGKAYSPAWATLNFKAMYQFNKWIGVNAGIENILDVRYRPYSSGLAAAGRNFILSAKATF